MLRRVLLSDFSEGGLGPALGKSLPNPGLPAPSSSILRRQSPLWVWRTISLTQRFPQKFLVASTYSSPIVTPVVSTLTIAPAAPTTSHVVHSTNASKLRIMAQVSEGIDLQELEGMPTSNLVSDMMRCTLRARLIYSQISERISHYEG
uniref:Uncharacterized protein isoform X1 n=1 Tax=Nicotiana tabacum TaxID=4097 RepID=A0A1S3YNX4_TOBAC|nr:PREDICTED: uncharacterized protein LOC107778122 isoform X1 [Nicotiana tabacum]